MTGQQNVIVSVIDPGIGSTVCCPTNLAFDGEGNLLIATAAHQVWRLTPAGVVPVAGTGQAGSSGDSGKATGAQLNSPNGMAASRDGSVYIAEAGGHRIRKVAPEGTISTFAGTGVAGFSGDGGPAEAQIACARSKPMALSPRSLELIRGPSLTVAPLTRLDLRTRSTRL